MAAKAQGKEVTMEDFAAAIKESVKEANEELLQSLNGGSKKGEASGETSDDSSSLDAKLDAINDRLDALDLEGAANKGEAKNGSEDDAQGSQEGEAATKTEREKELEGELETVKSEMEQVRRAVAKSSGQSLEDDSATKEQEEKPKTTYEQLGRRSDGTKAVKKFSGDSGKGDPGRSTN